MFRSHRIQFGVWGWLLLTVELTVFGDGILFTYEGEMLPYAPQGGFPSVNPCDPPCQESIEAGYFVLSYPECGDLAGYGHQIAVAPQLPPPSLWLEWNFRSNHVIPSNFYTCNASLGLQYQGIVESVYMYGDAAVSAGADFTVFGLDAQLFHSYRFESLDGVNYTISVDGEVFIDSFDPTTPSGFNGFGFSGKGGCPSDCFPGTRNEWDFIRYGTIGFGERIVASDPPVGFLNPNEHASRDRFTVTYDSPNYAYIDDITASVTCATAPNCPQAPQVIATKRLDNGPPDVLEIVLDRPLPSNARTVFTFTDVDPANPTEPTINNVSYTFQLGDVNADGEWNLFDFASMQNCFYQLANTNICAAFDFTGDIFVDSNDYAQFHELAFP